MGKRKRTKSPLQKEYEKQRLRLKAAVRRAEKRGYRFGDNPIPPRPKSIRQASVNRLKKITPEKLRAKATMLVDFETGEITELNVPKYTQGTPTQQPTNTSGFNPPENINTDVSFYDLTIITQFRANVNQFNEYSSNILNTWLDRLLVEHSPHDIAQMLEDGAEQGLLVNYTIVYDRDKLMGYMSDMLDYLPDEGSLFKEQFMEALEMDEVFETPQ